MYLAYSDMKKYSSYLWHLQKRLYCSDNFLLFYWKQLLERLISHTYINISLNHWKKGIIILTKGPWATSLTWATIVKKKISFMKNGVLYKISHSIIEYILNKNIYKISSIYSYMYTKHQAPFPRSFLKTT